MIKAISFFYLSFILWSQTPASTPNEHIYQTTLANGLDVIVIENSTVPLVTVEIDVRNGAFTETPEFDGLSHVFEHMFFKANESIPNQERFLERTRELGMIFNASTSEERVNYAFTVPKDSLDASMRFMRAAITSPLFLNEELERERLVIIDEYDRNESNPVFHLNREVDKRLWYRYHSRKNVIGDRDIIMSVSQDQLRSIQKKYYIPNNSALLVAGAVNHQEVFSLANQYFDDWAKGPDPFIREFIPFHPPLEKSETVIVEQPVNDVTIMLRWQGPSVSVHTKTTYAADVFTFLMNQNSKLPRILVGTGLFTSISFSYLTLDYKGPITIVGRTTKKKFNEAKTALFEELKYLIDPEYFTDEQIDYARTRMEVREMYSFETPSTFVQSIGFWWAVAGGLDYYLNYFDNLSKVTRKDINQFVKRYIQDAPYVMGILVSPEDRKELGL